MKNDIAHAQLSNEMKDSSKPLIFQSRCLLESHIKSAKLSKVPIMTFENLSQLQKLTQFYPNSKLLIKLDVTNAILYNSNINLDKFEKLLSSVSDIIQTYPHIVGICVTSQEIKIFDNSLNGGQQALIWYKQLFDASFRALELCDQKLNQNYKHCTMNALHFDIPGFGECQNKRTLEKISSLFVDQLDQYSYPQNLMVSSQITDFLLSNHSAWSFATPIISVRPTERSKSSKTLSNSPNPSVFINNSVYDVFEHLFVNEDRYANNRSMADDGLEDKCNNNNCDNNKAYVNVTTLKIGQDSELNGFFPKRNAHQLYDIYGYTGLSEDKIVTDFGSHCDLNDSDWLYFHFDSSNYDNYEERKNNASKNQTRLKYQPMVKSIYFAEHDHRDMITDFLIYKGNESRNFDQEHNSHEIMHFALYDEEIEQYDDSTIEIDIYLSRLFEMADNTENLQQGMDFIYKPVNLVESI
ncbi:unnamed protein product [Gordionus sp. m RMFG-2023]